MMLVNVINSTFEAVSALPARVKLLETFYSITKREAVRRAVDKKTSEVYNAYIQDLNQVKKHFDKRRRSPPTDVSHPQFAGAAIWATSLLRRMF